MKGSHGDKRVQQYVTMRVSLLLLLVYNLLDNLQSDMEIPNNGVNNNWVPLKQLVSNFNVTHQVYRLEETGSHFSVFTLVGFPGKVSIFHSHNTPCIILAKSSIRASIVLLLFQNPSNVISCCNIVHRLVLRQDEIECPGVKQNKLNDILQKKSSRIIFLQCTL
jgi:hypothetical protein